MLMRNRYDQVAKQIGKEALSPSGATVAQDEITAETMYADLRHEPDLARQTERDRLGLLGRLATGPCLIEVYSEAPDAEAFRACLAKHLVSWQGRARRTRAENRKRSERGNPPDAFVDSFLWIIAAGAPTTLLSRLGLEPAPGWPAGIYLFGAEVLRVGLVVASELPRDATTLLIRLMAAGPLLAQAVNELAALPRDAHERAVAEPVLLAFQHALERNPSRTPDEQEFIVAMYKTWEEGRAEARTEGRIEGRTEGRTEGQANAVLTVLRVRGIAVPDPARLRILAQTDPARLERWLEQAITATSVADVIDDLS
jgi:hypothetical protein